MLPGLTSRRVARYICFTTPCASTANKRTRRWPPQRDTQSRALARCGLASANLMGTPMLVTSSVHGVLSVNVEKARHFEASKDLKEFWSRKVVFRCGENKLEVVMFGDNEESLNITFEE